MAKNCIYGIHSVYACLKKHPERVVQIMIQKDNSNPRIQDCLALAKEAGIAIEYWHKGAIEKNAQTEQHQGILAYVHAQPVLSEVDLPDLIQKSASPFFLVLDGIQDPHNLGAVLRSADAAGVDAVIIPRDKNVSLTPVVRKVASGAAETVPLVTVTNLARSLRLLKEAGIWLYGADGEGDKSLYETTLSGPLAWVMGAEGQGLRRLTKESCDYLVKIPMAGYVSSLNVSVASAVLLFETVRQRCVVK